MDQAKAVINLKEGIIQLEGPVDFVRRYLERYGSAATGLPAAEPEAVAPKEAVKAPVRRRGGQRSCARAIRAEIKAGFLDEPKSAQALRQRLAEKGVAYSGALLRLSLRKIAEEGRLSPAGRGRGRVYCRAAAPGETA